MPINSEEVKQAVFSNKPVLKKTIQDNEGKTLAAYFEHMFVESSFDYERRKDLIGVVANTCSELLGIETAEALTASLENNYFASTADHHGFIGHPFFFNADMCQSLAAMQRNQQAVLILSCGSIAMNNSSFPRGLLVHDEKLEERRLHFFSTKYRHVPVHAMSAYTKEQESRILKELNSIDLAAAKKDLLKRVISEVCFSTAVMEETSFSHQATIVNNALWKLIPGQEKVEFIQLEQEEITRRLLLQFHFETETLLWRLLFNPNFRKAFARHFDGITGAFNTKSKRGSYMFWALREGKRIALEYDGKHLVSTDGLLIIPFEAEVIERELKAKRLIPTMALSFIVLSFYYGLRCGGGFSQINYLGEIKRAYMGLLAEMEELDENKRVEPIDTEFFCGEFVMMEHKNKKAAFALDMLLSDRTIIEKVISTAFHTKTLGASVEAMMPEFYKIITGTYPSYV